MLVAKLFFGVFLIVLSVACEVLVRRSRKNTLAFATTLHNPEVKSRWIENDLPQCVAYQSAVRLGAAFLGLIGMAVIGTAVLSGFQA